MGKITRRRPPEEGVTRCKGHVENIQDRVVILLNSSALRRLVGEPSCPGAVDLPCLLHIKQLDQGDRHTGVTIRVTWCWIERPSSAPPVAGKFVLMTEGSSERGSQAPFHGEADLGPAAGSGAAPYGHEKLLVVVPLTVVRMRPVLPTLSPGGPAIPGRTGLDWAKPSGLPRKNSERRTSPVQTGQRAAAKKRFKFRYRQVMSIMRKPLRRNRFQQNRTPPHWFPGQSWRTPRNRFQNRKFASPKVPLCLSFTARSDGGHSVSPAVHARDLPDLCPRASSDRALCRHPGLETGDRVGSGLRSALLVVPLQKLDTTIMRLTKEPTAVPKRERELASADDAYGTRYDESEPPLVIGLSVRARTSRRPAQGKDWTNMLTGRPPAPMFKLRSLEDQTQRQHTTWPSRPSRTITRP
ncbi:hypothetical protein GWK47_028235 [Chionoecetes opilio]|uniref:Uncharacterized protein n=1 Tax=Chionoecetes opilio TaxID=41210 RepID=A0A8J4YTA1_CHIOP|nr:hypothetical protein GWK47_028235 [Chionoecetes opilio]